LLVLAAHPEEGIDESRTVAALAAELSALAGWLGLANVKVTRRGVFARRLADYIKTESLRN